MIDYLLSLPIKFALRILRIVLRGMMDHEKENLFLRFQLMMLKKQTKKPRFSAIDRALLTTTALSMKLKHWKDACLIIKPTTVMAWHRKLVHWKWTYPKVGRSRIENGLKDLILKMRKENPLWGRKRIHGELLKLGFRISESSVRNILRKAGLDPLDPAPRLSWVEFLKRHKQVWAIDFFTVETGFLKRVFVFVILEIHSRKLIALRTTIYPTQEWVINTLRSELNENANPQLLLRDRDGCYGHGAIKEMLKQRGIMEVLTPVMSPMANAFCERQIGSIRRECTDHFLFISEEQIQSVLNLYKTYSNQARPHQGIEQKIPCRGSVIRKDSADALNLVPTIIAKEAVFGLHHDYSFAT